MIKKDNSCPQKKKKNKILPKKQDFYYPSQEFKKKAWVTDKKIYQKAQKDPVKFWEDLAGRLNWFEKWTKGFEHKPPFFKWFKGGKINITENIFKRERRDQIALKWVPEPKEEEAQTFTYRELLQKVNKTAKALKGLGVKKGDPVVIYLPLIPQALISMLACARIGAVHAVVFSAFSPKALQIRLQDTKAKVLITADGYYRRGKIMNLKEDADQGIKNTQVEKVIVVKRAGNQISFNKEKDIYFNDLIKDEKSQCKAEPMDSEDLQFILYTSGSTGRPKGTMHVCGGYTVQAYWTGKWIFDLHKDDVVWCTADIGWITGHTYALYSPLLNGATTLIYEGAPDHPKPNRWAEIIEEHKVNIFYTAPTAIRMFKKYGAGNIAQNNLSSLRLLGTVGEPIDETAWQWYFKNVGQEKCPIVDTWWQTETGGVLLSSLPGIGPFKPTFTGLPFPPIKAEIVDKEGKPCPPNKEGRLIIHPPFAPSLLRGVYKNPQRYKDTYWSEYGQKIYFTEDAALKDEKGLIRIVGRIDDVIKVAGHRLTSGQLEDAINLSSEINESAVVGVPDKIKGEVPIAFVVKGDHRDIPKEELQQAKKKIINQVREEIGPIATLKEVFFVEDLPKTRSGKIMRRILRKLFTGGDLGDLSTLANAESVEQIKEKLSQEKIE